MQDPILLLDGGMGHTLRRNGVRIQGKVGSIERFLNVALANCDAPRLVVDSHLSFLRTGSNVITTNSYSCVPRVVGCDDDLVIKLIEAAGRLAQAACAVFAREQPRAIRPLVAGCVPPLNASYRPERVGGDAELRETYALIVRHIMPYSDVLLCETMSSAREARLAAEAASQSGKPVWVSWTLADDESCRLRSGEPIEHAVAELSAVPNIQAMLINCSRPSSITAALSRLRSAAPANVRLGAYGNGFVTVEASGGDNSDPQGISEYDPLMTPRAFADQAQLWLGAGASLIGGCCGIFPEHIAEISRRVKPAQTLELNDLQAGIFNGAANGTITRDICKDPLDENRRRAVNHVPLSPITFLERAAAVFPERLAVIYGERRLTWSDMDARCRRAALALQRAGIGQQDVVALMLANTPEMLELHFAVPLVGACLNPINVRLDARSISIILAHGEVRLAVVDTEFERVIDEAISKLPDAARSTLHTILYVVDAELGEPSERSNRPTYEDALRAVGPPLPFGAFPGPCDEWETISLNYTSGTTGNPKGVQVHHRGAYLESMANLLIWGVAEHPIYLWTLPMFHCNGWCFPWSIAACAGTNVCLRRTTAANIYAAISTHRVTHFCGAPIIMQMILAAPVSERRTFEHKVKMLTAAAPPPAIVLAEIEKLNIEVTHVYGLTEVYGPAVVCVKQEEWQALDGDAQAALNARQGVRYPVLEGLMVADPETLRPVPKDGTTMGEIFMRGNIVFKGYFKNPQATEEAFWGGWFHTGDLAVWHEDGYVQIKDRSKDIIISGGENISSVEVGDVLHSHPAIADVAIVAMPDEKWGEAPCAFVELLPNARTVTTEELRVHCKERLAGFKVPRMFVFATLPRSSTGKVAKVELREQAKRLSKVEPRSRL